MHPSRPALLLLLLTCACSAPDAPRPPDPLAAAAGGDAPAAAPDPVAPDPEDATPDDGSAPAPPAHPDDAPELTPYVPTADDAPEPPAGSTPEAEAEDAPDPIGPPAPTIGRPTANDALPAVPFRAWTLTAPLTLVGPGGTTMAVLQQAPFEVEVLQVLPDRVRLRCATCPGPAAGLEGWIPVGLLSVERPR